MQRKLGFSGCPTAVAGDERAVSERISKLPSLVGLIVLDLGCGVGAYTYQMQKKGAMAIGLDLNERYLIEAHNRYPSVDLVYATGERLPIKDSTLDIVTMYEVIEHVSDDVLTISECYRAIKYNGRLILSTPNRLFPYQTHGMNFLGRQIKSRLRIPFLPWFPFFIRKHFENVRIYSIGQIIHLVQSNGFYPICVKTIMPTLDTIKPNCYAQAVRKVLLRMESFPFMKLLGDSMIVQSVKLSYGHEREREKDSRKQVYAQ